jgi:hypothetical protein
MRIEFRVWGLLVFHRYVSECKENYFMEWFIGVRMGIVI